jgi:hypothetical protein
LYFGINEASFFLFFNSSLLMSVNFIVVVTTGPTTAVDV